MLTHKTLGNEMNERKDIGETLAVEVWTDGTIIDGGVPGFEDGEEVGKGCPLLSHEFDHGLLLRLRI